MRPYCKDLSVWRGVDDSDHKANGLKRFRIPPRVKARLRRRHKKAARIESGTLDLEVA